MFPFDVILFDVGGVLLTNGWDTRERVLAAEQFHLDLTGLEARHQMISGQWERGAIPVDTYLQAVVFNEPRPFSRDDFWAFMLAQSQLLPNGAFGTLKELAASNRCMLGALNNEARETNEYRFSTFHLYEYFRVALSSCFLGMRKPEPVIYQRAVDILMRPAERILFIDDRPENVVGAAKAGIRAIQFQGEEALRKELASLGVL